LCASSSHCDMTSGENSMLYVCLFLCRSFVRQLTAKLTWMRKQFVGFTIVSQMKTFWVTSCVLVFVLLNVVINYSFHIHFVAWRSLFTENGVNSRFFVQHFLTYLLSQLLCYLFITCYYLISVNCYVYKLTALVYELLIVFVSGQVTGISSVPTQVTCVVLTSSLTQSSARNRTAPYLDVIDQLLRNRWVYGMPDEFTACQMSLQRARWV